MKIHDLMISVLFAAATFASACGDSGDTAAPMPAGDAGGDGGGAVPGVGPGVGQGGAQDFGQFRAILDAGGIPGPATLDDVGFFAEHAFEFGPADCGADVCVHGELARLGDVFEGRSQTVLAIGLNTPIDPAIAERPPLHLVLAIDVSGSMQGQPLAYVQEGLRALVPSLEPEDRITLVSFADAASVVFEHVEGDAPVVDVGFDTLVAEGQTNIYGGLRAAYEAAERHAQSGRQNRVFLLSDGVATTGLASDPKIVALASAYASAGFGLATVGFGTAFDPQLMRTLAETGGGAFYFVDDLEAVGDVFVEEAAAWWLPLAQDATISLEAEAGYRVQRVLGTRLSTATASRAVIDLPLLQLAHRQGHADQAGGRRGGGGAILVELVPEPDAGPVGELHLGYRVPFSEVWVDQLIEVPAAPGDDQMPYFGGPAADKAFMTLACYEGFVRAAELAEDGDDATATAILATLGDALAAWLDAHDDGDISDDLRYVDRFVANLAARAR